MRVEEYIEQLLYRYECVIVPGFGAFVTQKNSTEYHPKTHKFTPPSKRITFNKAIQNHDGLLAETIAKGESMDFESAKQKIQLFVEDFQIALHTDKVVSIPSLGRFCLDNEGKMSFEPNNYINYFIESFGLKEISLDAVSQSISNLEEEKVTSKVKPLHPDTTSTNANDNSVTRISAKENNSKPYLKYAAVGILALGLASFAGLYQYNNYVISYNDNETQKAEELLQNQIQSAEFSYTLSELPLTTKKEKAVLPKYHIIAGAFRVENNALKKVDQLKVKGFEASLIGVNTYGLHQVTFGSYSNKEEALAELRKIKATESPEAWLFVKQL
jgi:nucleoid DNA-binding protein